jgi:hypothetical protein
MLYVVAPAGGGEEIKKAIGISLQRKHAHSLNAYGFLFLSGKFNLHNL